MRTALVAATGKATAKHRKSLPTRAKAKEGSRTRSLPVVGGVLPPPADHRLPDVFPVDADAHESPPRAAAPDVEEDTERLYPVQHPDGSISAGTPSEARPQPD